MRVLKVIFVIREWANFFLKKCEMACFSLENRDFIRSREMIKYLIFCDPCFWLPSIILDSS